MNNLWWRLMNLSNRAASAITSYLSEPLFSNVIVGLSCLYLGHPPTCSCFSLDLQPCWGLNPASSGVMATALPVSSQNWPLAQLPVPSDPWEFLQSNSQCSFLVTFHSPAPTSSIAHPVYVWGGWTLFYEDSICTPPLQPCFQQFPWLLQLLAALHQNCFLLARKLETGYTRKREITFLMSSHLIVAGEMEEMMINWSCLIPYSHSCPSVCWL